MIIFRATATNALGYTFAFTFRAFNWNGIQEVADVALKDIVDGDPLHQKLGPWAASQIDIGA